MQGPVEAVIEKGAVKRIQIGLYRTFKGIQLSVKVSPEVEEFARTISDGQIVNVKMVGRHWRTAEDAKPLQFYNLAEEYSRTLVNEPLGYRLDAIGQPLFDPESGAINLSFLRLVGISEGAGVTFTIRQVSSLDGLRQMRDALGKAGTKFYRDLIRPVDLPISISTQEIFPAVGQHQLSNIFGR